MYKRLPFLPPYIYLIMDNYGSFNEPQELLTAFRTHYCHLEHLVTEATMHATDSTVLARLGDKLAEYINLIIQVSSQTSPHGYNSNQSVAFGSIHS